MADRVTRLRKSNIQKMDTRFTHLTTGYCSCYLSLVVAIVVW